jgi:hypothetical protein
MRVAPSKNCWVQRLGNKNFWFRKVVISQPPTAQVSKVVDLTH